MCREEILLLLISAFLACWVNRDILFFSHRLYCFYVTSRNKKMRNKILFTFRFSATFTSFDKFCEHLNTMGDN